MNRLLVCLLFVFGPFVVAGCGTAEVVTWYIDAQEQKSISPVTYERVKVMSTEEWEAFRTSPSNTGFRKIADIRGSSVSALRDFCAKLGGDALVEVDNYARAVPRATAFITRFFYKSAYDLKVVEDYRGTAVITNPAPEKLGD